MKKIEIAKIVDAVDSIWKSSKKTYGLIRIQKKVKEIDKSYGSRRIRNIFPFFTNVGYA